MADDLMDFSEFDAEENDENVDPEVEIAPKLMQTPVVKHSILKQSTKDNLIQLFTPVQKNKKLKVHFTPNVVQSAENVVGDTVLGSCETRTALTSNDHDEVVPEDDEEREEWAERTSVLTKKDHEDYTQYAQEFVLELVANLPIKEEEPSSDSGIDESMMDVQEETTQVSTQPNDTSSETEKYDDILSQAADLLKSLRQQTGSTSSEIEDTVKINTVPSVCADQTVEDMDCDEPMDVDVSVLQTEVNEFPKEQEIEVPVLSDTSKLEKSEIPLERAAPSEEQESHVESGTESQSTETREKGFDQKLEKQVDFSVEEKETIIRKHEDNNADECVNIEPELEHKTAEVNILETFDKNVVDSSKNETSQNETDSLNSIQSNSDMVDTCLSSETTESSALTEKIGKESEISSEKTDAGKSKRDDGNSSDEEFLSADEDVLTDQMKETESPVRTPPKVGYNLNFDDLESMNPFQTNKCVQNTPDKDKNSTQFQNKDSGTAKDEEVKSVNKDSHIAADGNSLDCKDDLANSDDISEVNNASHDISIKTMDSSVKAVISDDKIASSSEPDESESKQNEDIIQDEELTKSPPLPQRGTYNLDFLDDIDDIDPFKPKVQMMNSPVAAQRETSQPKTTEAEPFKPSTQLMNSPVVPSAKAVPDINTGKDENIDEPNESGISVQSDAVPEVDKSITTKKKKKKLPSGKKESESNLPENLDDIDPFKTGNKIMNSPSSSQTTYVPLPDNLDEIDPFKPKNQMMNSPIASDKLEGNGTSNSSEISKSVHEIEGNMVAVCETKIKELPENFDEIDPFKPTHQMVNSPTRASTMNNLPENLDDIEPLKPKNQILNSPDKISNDIGLPDNPDEIDPFKPNKQTFNSSHPDKVCEKIDFSENLGNIDPFKPQKQIINSPDKCLAGNALPDNLEDIDPFKPRKQMMNSPVSSSAGSSFPDILDTVDPFKSESKVMNSPDARDKSTNGQSENFEEVDPFKPRNQMKNSPVSKVSKTDKESSNSDLADEQFKAAFDDIDPFKTKSQIQNSPKLTLKEDLDDIDPFKPRKQMANSPVGKTTEPDTGAIGLWPEAKSDPFINRRRLPDTPEENFSSEEEVMEVQGVTRRGAAGSSNPQGFDIDESEFVAASEVFKDPGVWEMLEQFGSNASNPTQESALSRMSLYVKFDPLVDSTKMAANPRRISIRPKQLEKVKEYGLDETLLLLGTPPKKRRQSMNVSQLRHTPVTSKQTPTGDTQKRKELNMGQGAVDLIMALSPEDLNTMSSKQSSHPPSLLSTLDPADDAAGLFEELKYTDSDLRRLRTDFKLEFQGQMIVQEKAWCKEKEHYQKLLKESRAALEAEKKSSQEMAKACFLFEETIQKLSGIQENDKKQIETLNKEKQQMFEDVQGVENSFADLHRRYEKLKTVVEDQRKNEETLKKYAADVMEKLKKMEEKYHTFKKAADEKDSKSTQEITKLKAELTADQNKHEAAKKILSMKVENLERQLEQKKEENKNLTEICDQLIQNAGN